MIKRTTYTFDLPITTEEDIAEYDSLVRALNDLHFDGEISGDLIEPDRYQITVERVQIP